MRITIEVDISDPLLDLSECRVIETTETVEYGDRKELVTVTDCDFNPKYNGYDVVDCDYDYLEAHLTDRREPDYDEPSETTEWSDYDRDC